MSVLRWLAPVTLAMVLAAAAGAKLASYGPTRESFDALGLPAPRVLAVGVPLFELATAVALVAAPPVGGALAIALLVGFSAFLIRKMVAGSDEPCACFGRVRVRPISPVDLVRNGVLLALATVTLLWPPT